MHLKVDNRDPTYTVICKIGIPQMIMLTFDGAVNLNNYDHYSKIFNGKRKNPNGCNIRGTFFLSHEYRNIYGPDIYFRFLSQLLW
uniref:Uncharacterized protein n=1 Tax=Glossina palpalis gambiensis TaxID=67801 RepID=A0A1B0AX89_9MUSC